MKIKTALAFLAITSTVFQPSAIAQIPVTDGASIMARAMEHAAEIAKWVQQIEEMQNQLEQMEKSYKQFDDSMNGSRGLGTVANNPAYKDYLPAEWKELYDQVRNTGGYGSLSSPAKAIYDEVKIFDGCQHHGSREAQLNCEALAVKGSIDKAHALDAYQKAKDRLSQIETLMSQINTTTDPKGVAEIQARIGAEQAMIQNEAAKLKMFEMIATAEDKLLAQQRHEMNMRDAAKRGTLGVTAKDFKLGGK